MEDKYKEALHQAQEELAQLEARRDALLRLIASLKELAENDRFPFELTPPPGYVPLGLTGEMRAILALTTDHLNAVQIRDVLVTRRFPHSSSKNLLINVHTVLGRLQDTNELDVIERDGRPAYKAKPSSMLDVNIRTAETLAALGESPKKHATLPHVRRLTRVEIDPTPDKKK